jgi:hypothetical protein
VIPCQRLFHASIGAVEEGIEAVPGINHINEKPIIGKLAGYSVHSSILL